MLPFYLLTLAASIQAHVQLLPGSCNFESSTCGYTSDADFTSWTLHKDGRFVAVDAALDHDQEDDTSSDAGPQRETKGVLLSPALDQDEWSCLRLVYQITGSGSLEVLQRSRGKSFDSPLWSSRTPSDSWVISSIDLQNTTESYR
ncbi:hypothetical protein LDENG_00257010, partial [Lucifuga dentata]